jgi:dTDP-4-amino-4,6-dideoxygalactose transaminase
MDEQRESYFAGTNAKLNEFSASVILASFDAYENTRLDLSSAARKAMEISDQNNLEVHNAMKKGFASPYWIIKSNPKRILEIESTFDMVSISTRRWWMKGCHRMQAYSAIPSTDLKNTNAASDSSIGLPFYPNMNEVEWDRINEAIRRA